MTHRRWELPHGWQRDRRMHKFQGIKNRKSRIPLASVPFNRYCRRPFLTRTDRTSSPLGLRQSERLGRGPRCVLAGAGLGLAVLLAIAGWLKPSPDGFGTHRQLGLPPCTFRSVVGVRCPSCGMTTSWAHMVRGQWKAAVATNTAGALLALLAAAASPWALLSAVRGEWTGFRPRDRAVVILVATIAGITLLDWTVRIIFDF